MKTETVTTRPIGILFVEDNPADAELVKGALERSRHPVHVVVTGTAGLAMDFLRREVLHGPPFPIDFILLDLGLPDKSGWEVLSALKGDPQFMEIPVLILTGSLDEHELLRARFSFADDCLQKPFDLAHLGALVDYLEETWFKRGP